jgi:hypothetical protein
LLQTAPGFGSGLLAALVAATLDDASQQNAIALAVMLNLVLALTIIIAALAQAQVPEAYRFGPTASHLSDNDLKQIRLSASGRPWVIVGRADPFDAADLRWYVEAFLEADRVSAGLRRGSIEGFSAELPSRRAYGAPKKWNRAWTGEYVQVPAPGRDPLVLSSSRDLSRPFRIVGSFTDEELISLVTFVRGSPAGSEAPSGGRVVTPIFRAIKGDWPIASVVQLAPDVVEVSLLDEQPSEKSGQMARVRARGGGWAIERLYVWNAD